MTTESVVSHIFKRLARWFALTLLSHCVISQLKLDTKNLLLAKHEKKPSWKCFEVSWLANCVYKTWSGPSLVYTVCFSEQKTRPSCTWPVCIKTIYLHDTDPGSSMGFNIHHYATAALTSHNKSVCAPQSGEKRLQNPKTPKGAVLRHSWNWTKKSGRDEEAWEHWRWGDRRCWCSLGRSTPVTVKRKNKREWERDATSIRLYAWGIFNWICHAIWSGGVQLEPRSETCVGQAQQESSLRQTKIKSKGEHCRCSNG